MSVKYSYQNWFCFWKQYVGVVGGIVMAVGGGNVAVSLGLGGTVVVNVIDVVCPFCLCCVLGGVVDPDLLLGRLRSLTKLITCYALFLKSDWLVALLFLLK